MSDIRPNVFPNNSEKPKRELTEAEKQYVNLIEPLIQNYRGGGYTEILGSR